MTNKVKKCPKCKGEMERWGYLGAWFIENNDGTPDLNSDLNGDTANNLWKNFPDEEKWVCEDCDYKEAIELKGGKK